MRLLAPPLLALCAIGCFTPADDAPIAPPPVNPRITEADAPLRSEPRAANVEIFCDGPGEQVAMLGAICGTGDFDWSLVRTEDDARAGWGLALRSVDWDPEIPTRGLLLFTSAPRDADDLVADAGYSAYVAIAEPTEWEGGETITSGRIHSEAIGADACGPAWIGTAELTWRETTLLATWYVAPGC